MDSNVNQIEVQKPQLADTVVRTPGVTRQEFRRKQREVSAKFVSGTTRNGLPKQEIPTIVMVDCPKCKKHRLTKYLGDDGKHLPVSTETVDVRGETRMLDVCDVCNFHYREADKKFIMDNLVKLQRAMRSRKVNRTSDKDFSIDL
jgi:hypothetical protein